MFKGDNTDRNFRSHNVGRKTLRNPKARITKKKKDKLMHQKVIRASGYTSITSYDGQCLESKKS